MVTSVTPIIEQHMPRAQARAGGQDAYVRFDFGAYLDSSTSTTQLANETPDQSHVAARNRAGEYCCNQQYSVTAITTSTGAIAERYAYTAYGQPTILNASGTPLSPQTSTLNSRYSYTGREWDSTLGLHHFRARWMSPSAGRFLGRDPIGYVDSTNLFAIEIFCSATDSSGNQKDGPINPPNAICESDWDVGLITKQKRSRSCTIFIPQCLIFRFGNCSYDQTCVCTKTWFEPWWTGGVIMIPRYIYEWKCTNTDCGPCQ